MAEKHIVRGALAGIAGGLVASWVMNEWITGPGAKLSSTLESESNKREQAAESQRQEASGEPREDATMKAADAIVNTVKGGEHLSLAGKQAGGPVVHYSFGALMGGVYGVLAEYSKTARSGAGMTFGAALFAGADLLAVPALELAPPPTEQSAAQLAAPFTAHLVYGATTELVRRVVRVIL
jgi:putative membrane protein